MSQTIRKEMRPRLRQRYLKRGAQGKSALIEDEVCEQWDYSRKYAIKLLKAKAGWRAESLKKKNFTIALFSPFNAGITTSSGS